LTILKREGDALLITGYVTALTNSNQLNRIEKQTATALDKVSSGLRIRQAADDAAGLAISEKMRAQIRGLSQAARNVQDGISLIQTAEGGLCNILEPPLQRLRELAIQAGNGTLTEQDRYYLQNEADQIIKEIDQIAQNTEFNSKKLLNGTYQSPPITTATPLTAQWQVEFTGKEIVSISAANDGGVVVAGRTGSFGASSQSWLAKVDSGGNTLWETILPQDNSYNVIYDIHALDDGSFIASGRRTNLLTGNKEAVLYRITANGEVQDKAILSMGDEQLFEIKPTTNGGFIAVGVAGQDVIIRKLDANLAVTQVQSFARPAGVHFKTAIDVVQTSDQGFVVVGEETNAFPLGSTGFILKVDDNLNLQWEAKEVNTVFSSIVNMNSQQYLVLSNTGLYTVDSTGALTALNPAISQIADPFDYEHDWLKKTADDQYLIGTSDKLYKVNISGEITWSLDIPALAVTQAGDRGYIVATTAHSLMKITPEALPSSNTDTGLKIQAGANAGNTLTLYINDVSAQALGLQDLDLTATGNLSTTLNRIDSAIRKVSAERSGLGAYHNALEHILNNVQNSGSNLTAAESRVRDVDVAKASMDVIKLNLLTQMNQIVLSQANQQPQHILRLLKDNT